MKKATLTEDKAEKTPTGGVLVGKREGQTIIHNKGTLSGYLVGRTHAKGGIKAVNKSTGQPLEMQGGEVVITAPAVSDNTKNEFNGKMMTNREILSQINVKGGGVAFAKDGMEIPKNIRRTGASYNYGGKTMTDHEIYRHITKRQKQSLVRDAKSGNTPARDLNNYNDVLDLQADNMVGADTGLFVRGGGVKKTKTTPSQTSVPNSKVLTKKDLQDSKIWIGDDLDLRDRVVARLIELGIPEDSRYTAKSKLYLTNIFIQTYSDDFVIYKDFKKDFDKRVETEIFPADLLSTATTSTPASTPTKLSLNSVTEIQLYKLDANDPLNLIGVANNINELYELFLLAEKDGVHQFFLILKNSIEENSIVGWIEKVNSERDIYPSNITIDELKSWIEQRKGNYIIQSYKIDLDYFFSKGASSNAMQPTTTTTSGNTKFFQFTGETLTEIPDSVTPFSGIIKDLPEKIKQLALQSQVDAGNTPNEDLRVKDSPLLGNFSWEETGEGNDFWDSINVGDFKPFKKIYGDYGEGLTGINIGTTPTSANDITDDNLKIIDDIVNQNKPFDLTKTKIWIDNLALSEKVQKKAFELGWEWYGYLKNVQDKDIPVALFFDDTKLIEWTNNKNYFDNETNDYKEIFESDLFPTSTASQTSKQNMPVEDEDWAKKFTADLDKLVFAQGDLESFPQLSKEEKDLENLKKLLPSFQQKKYAIERAKILKEIKRLHNKLTYEGFIQGNEEGSTGADLFTPQGLLDYYFTQATQNPTAELEEPCGLPTPNGQNSKLPLSAYLNVRTPQFKNWFGDWEKAYETGNYVNCSKMIDPDTKEPKIYFHGVRKYVPNFGQFSNMGQGVVRPYGAFEPTFPASYFAGEEDYAKFYGGVAENLPTPSADYKPFIYKVFLSVKNPISLLPLDFMLSYKDFLDYIYVGYGVKVTPNQQLLTILDNDMIKKNPMWIYIRRDIGVIELLKDYGYDAIFQMGDIPVFLPNGEVEPDRTKHLQEIEYLTFYPNQVKSATVKKSFYFDFFNDIRFKNGGYVRI